MMGRVRFVGVAMLGLMCIAAPLAAQQAPAAAKKSPRRSWTADRQEFAVGDVITVLIDEYTVAAANRDNFASNRRHRDLSLGVAQSISASVPPLAADVSSSSRAESSQRGEAVQENRFQGEMTVRVTEVEPSGLLRVEGIKLVDIDNSKQELALRGWVRPQDVSARNMVDSWRLGDAELTYTSKGSLGKPRGGIIGKILGSVWP
ncbi:MAG: flagellar basal body L-ring protein FlgH [Gemmatimonadetes bacterium]|nr:flagellar basal body L-ring protein FlgH [Gemmatimonadota bacterium]